MAKRKSFSKTHSVKRLPKGLPTRSKSDTNSNPFELTQRRKRPKFTVHNRTTSLESNPHQLQRVQAERQSALAAALQQQRKANVFSDQRIGEHELSNDAKNLARLVRERARQSKRRSQYALPEDDDGGVLLTHQGRAIRDMSAVDHVVLSDDEDDDGDLDALDTAGHFGGGRADAHFHATYGDTGGLRSAYEQKKQDLDDRIQRRKALKLERLQAKEEQVDRFEALDQSFAELSGMLQFRDKEAEIQQRVQARREGTVPADDQEYDDWDREMKEYLFATRKVAATDRTKTPEEIAQEEAERLRQLETRRLARMNGDVDDEDVEGDRPWKRKERKGVSADALEDEDDDDDDTTAKQQRTTRFTSEGLVYVDRNGVVLGKVGDLDAADDSSSEKDEETVNRPIQSYNVGDKVTANYRAKEQYGGQEAWYSGVIAKVVQGSSGNSIAYDVEYDDGDFEEGVEAQYIRPAEEKALEKESDSEPSKDREVDLRRKRQKVMAEARNEIPYVFEVPTTLESFHTLISTYATTGSDVSLIVQRIHKTNSVRLDRRNCEKMQNFYDVLLRRFVAVGDAIYTSGNGGPELDRYQQLDSLTQTLYAMAQEAPDIAGAVWNRRLGLLQSAHSKRLRDANIVDRAALDGGDGHDEEGSAWPSTGVLLLLRALGHVFPVTDQRHHVVTPALLFLGQMLGHTPLVSMHDLVMGTMCCGLLIEYTKEAKRLAPEAHAFLASVLRLFAHDASDRQGPYPLPTFQAASKLKAFTSLRATVNGDWDDAHPPQLSLELAVIRGNSMPWAILYACLHWFEVSIQNLSGSLAHAETEAFAEIAVSLSVLSSIQKKGSTKHPLPRIVKEKVISAVTRVTALQASHARPPLQRRATGPIALTTLAPRLEDPERYTVTKTDRHKSATQAELDRTRREYKREHKAVSRELRLDNSMVEEERRRVQDKKDAAAKAKRQRAFAWLESEQASMNQQVRQGGGLLQGGGTGAAKAKAASAKLGIKKGGKLR